MIAKPKQISRHEARDGDGSAVAALPMEWQVSPCNCWVSQQMATAIRRGEDFRNSPPIPFCPGCFSSDYADKSSRHQPSENMYWCARCSGFYSVPPAELAEAPGIPEGPSLDDLTQRKGRKLRMKDE